MSETDSAEATANYGFLDDSADEDWLRPHFIRRGALDMLLEYQRRVLAEEGFQDPLRLARTKALLARTSVEYWKSGVYDLFTLPYVQRYVLKEDGDKGHSTSQSGDGHMQPLPSMPSTRAGDANARIECVTTYFKFDKCCACAGYWEASLRSGHTVYICSGIPPKIPYTAVSYTWGEAQNQTVQCATCSYLTTFPIQSLKKFKSILSLVSGGTCIWLDALSIDQGDHSDIAQQVSQMGTIYKNATRVAVLLPAVDIEGYSELLELSDLAKQILSRPGHFHLNYNEPDITSSSSYASPSDAIGMDVLSCVSPDRRPSYTGPSISDLVPEFWRKLKDFGVRVSKLTYWQRAWTFQEWVLASDVDLGIETHEDLPTVEMVKTSIFSAAVLLAEYCLGKANP